MSEASGWAIVGSKGQIFIRTVSDTRRAAIVNWLVAEMQIPVCSWHTDADIEQMWNNCGQYVHCRAVTISELVPMVASPRSRPQLLGETK